MTKTSLSFPPELPATVGHPPDGTGIEERRRVARPVPFAKSPQRLCVPQKLRELFASVRDLSPAQRTPEMRHRSIISPGLGQIGAASAFQSREHKGIAKSSVRVLEASVGRLVLGTGQNKHQKEPGHVAAGIAACE